MLGVQGVPGVQGIPLPPGILRHTVLLLFGAGLAWGIIGFASAWPRAVAFEMPDRGPTMNANGCFLERVAPGVRMKVCIT